MSKGLFITGTDTGVGKTLVACALAAGLKNAGYKVGVLKPAETGCERSDGKLMPQDALGLKEASGCEVPLETICPYPLCEPLAPSVAAERQGLRIDIDRLHSLYEEIASAHDLVIVEGAGGLLVPILPSYTYADLARVLKLPLIVVAANRLGVINHLLLTLEHAACRGLRVLGYVLTQVGPELSLAAETNREVLESLTAVPCLAELPYLEELAGRDQSRLEVIYEQLDLQLLHRVWGVA